MRIKICVILFMFFSSYSFAQVDQIRVKRMISSESPWADVTSPTYGAKGDGVTDDTAAFQSAIDSGAKAIYIPYKATGYSIGSLNLPSTWSGRIFATSGGQNGKVTLKWNGDTGTMFTVHSDGTILENITLDGNNKDVILFHAYETVGGYGGAFKHSIMRNCTLVNTQNIAIKLGDYTTTGTDADIAESTFDNVSVFNAKYGVYVDGRNVLGMTFVNFRSTVLTTYTQESWGAVYIKRGGSLQFYGGYAGGHKDTGDTYAFTIETGGWLNIYGFHSEYGVYPNYGGFLYMGAPYETPTNYAPTLISGVRDYSRGLKDEAGTIIKLADSKPRLVLIGNHFVGRSGQAEVGNLIDNDNNALVTSIANTYVTPDPGLSGTNSTSLVDQTQSEETLTNLPAVFGSKLKVGYESGGVADSAKVYIRNDADEDMYIRLHAGDTAEQREYFGFQNLNKTDSWVMGKNAEPAFILYETASGVHRWKFKPDSTGGHTEINSEGTGEVQINNLTVEDPPYVNLGTGGLGVYSGGETPAKKFHVDNAGTIKIGTFGDNYEYGVIRYTSSGHFEIFPTSTGTGADNINLELSPLGTGSVYLLTRTKIGVSGSATAGMNWAATASVADGGTITHGSGSTPTAVICTPSVSAEMCSITTIGETTFTVAIKKHDGSAGTTQTIYWMALR